MAILLNLYHRILGDVVEFTVGVQLIESENFQLLETASAPNNRASDDLDGCEKFQYLGEMNESSDEVEFNETDVRSYL